jgi:hypothetical protein
MKIAKEKEELQVWRESTTLIDLGEEIARTSQRG